MKETKEKIYQQLRQMKNKTDIKICIAFMIVLIDELDQRINQIEYQLKCVLPIKLKDKP